MALVKTVELRILASAGDAQAKLDEIARKADEMEGNAIRMRFRVDDAAGKAQLDELRAKADRLGFKDVSIKVRVDGAGRAIADLMAVKHEEDKVREGGLLGRLGGLLGTSVPLGPLPAVPAAALPAVAAGLGAALVEVTGLVSGFAAAGAGAGAFYLLAHPAINNLTQDIQALSKANQNLGFAQQAERLDPTRAHLKAQQAAQLKYNAVYAQTGQDAGGAATGMIKLHDAYVSLSNAFAPQVFKVLNDGLKVAGDLLPHVAPFAATFASGLDGLLKQLGKFTQSKGFSDWLRQFHSLEGPAIGAIGHGIGQVAIAFGKLLTTMSGKDVAHAINIAFGGAAGIISGVALAVKFLMNTWDSVSAKFAQNIHGIAHTFDEVRHGIADSFGHAPAHMFDQVRHAAATAGHDIAHAFDTARHGIAAAFDGVGHAIAAKFGGVRHAIAAKFDGAIGWLKGAAHDVASGFDTVRHDIAAKFDDMRHTIAAKFDGAIGWLVSAGQNIIQGLINGINSMIGKIGGAIGHIASVIRSFLPFSPAKEGPLSGAGSPDIAGAKIASMLAWGMDSGAAGVSASAARLAGAAGIMPARGGYGRGGGDTHVHVHVSGIMAGTENEFAAKVHQLMLEYKRHGGRVPLGIG